MSVLLQKPIFDGISNRELAQQLEARKKCEKKLPIWFKTLKIYYPNKLNIEQTSSEITALYKSGIVTGKSLVDATGGLGVDSYFFSQKINQVFHFEIDQNLSEVAAHNFQIIGTENIRTIPTDGMHFLKGSTTRFDWIYLDPSRRNDIKGKVFRLSDCLPNVLDELDLLFLKSDNILLKTSPLLDFSIGIAELRFIKEIHVVAVKNEVKELLWVLEKGYSDEITIKTVNLKQKTTQVFDFRLSDEKEAIPRYSPPLSYLYEPNAAIMKAGGFKTVGNRFGLYKLHEHTHLYTSDTLIEFPGRRFKVDSQVPYTKKKLKRLSIDKANISTRNFPEKVNQIRNKFNIQDGGERFLLFVTGNKNDKMVLICSKVSQI